MDIRIKKIIIRYQAEIQETTENGLIEWRRLRVRDVESDALPENLQKEIINFLNKREKHMIGTGSISTNAESEI